MLFSVAVVAALLTFATRALRRRRFESGREERPGFTPGRAIPIQRFDEIAQWVNDTPCRDGSRPVIVSEGGVQFEGRSMRVVHVECESCADAFSLYFDLSGLLN